MKAAGCSHGEGAKHDCAYVDARNRRVDGAFADARGDVATFTELMNERMGTPNWNTPERARRMALHDLAVRS